MEQHPIPQNVSSYQFKLVGDMTLKQFFELAGGLVVALIFYSAPLIGIIKWPFVIVSALLGAGMAFVPLEERPLERWIFAFFKAIYTPTEFIWKKTTTPPKFFADESTAPLVGSSAEQDAALKNYLAGSKATTDPLAKLENRESGFLASLGALFAGLRGQTGVTPAAATVAVPAVPEVKKGLEIPVTTPTKIIPAGVPHLVVEERAKVIDTSVQATANQVSPIVAGNEMVSTKQAIFSIDAAPPNPPTTPNVVVGQVVDQDRKIVEGAIIEIRDEAGRPIRALRSNKLGHFITVTPLDNGRYGIVAEKDEYAFQPVTFEAVGAVIPPILVEGKSALAQEPIPAQVPTNQFAGQPSQVYASTPANPNLSTNFQ